MTAPTRHLTAPSPVTVPATRSLDLAVAHWRRATEIRREWLHWGLATEPADRPATEQALASIYARIGRPRPRFEWVDSPDAALRLTAGLPTHDVLHQWVMAPPSHRPPLASDLAAGLSRLRGALDECLNPPGFDPPPPKRPKGEPPKPRPALPPLDALRAGRPFREVCDQGVRGALRTSLANGFYLPVRAALGAGGSLPVCWYGQQEAYWIAYYDVWRRLGLARYRGADAGHLDEWAALARSCGWWWPGEDLCVVVERPATVHTEPIPGGWHEQVRPRRAGGPAVEYRDGWRPQLT